MINRKRTHTHTHRIEWSHLTADKNSEYTWNISRLSSKLTHKYAIRRKYRECHSHNRCRFKHSDCVSPDRFSIAIERTEQTKKMLIWDIWLFFVEKIIKICARHGPHITGRSSADSRDNKPLISNYARRRMKNSSDVNASVFGARHFGRHANNLIK